MCLPPPPPPRTIQPNSSYMDNVYKNKLYPLLKLSVPPLETLVPHLVKNPGYGSATDYRRPAPGRLVYVFSAREIRRGDDMYVEGVTLFVSIERCWYPHRLPPPSHPGGSCMYFPPGRSAAVMICMSEALPYLATPSIFKMDFLSQNGLGICACIQYARAKNGL